MRHARVGAAVTAVAVLALAGCSSSTSKPAAAPTGGAPASSTTAMPTFATDNTADDGLAGLGASTGYWDAHRNPDGNSPANRPEYGPDPDLPQVNGRTGDRYSLVTDADGYVTAYQVNFKTGTGITAALADVLRSEFPTDAAWEWKREVPGGCYQAEVKSAALAKGFKTAGLGDGTGQAFAEFHTVPADASQVFDASNITYASIDIMSYAKTDAPGC